jgi:hypothetical protein
MIEIELKDITKGPILRTIKLDEFPDKGDEIHLDIYPNNGPRVEEKYEIIRFYKIFKSAENTRYIALVKML